MTHFLFLFVVGLLLVEMLLLVVVVVVVVVVDDLLLAATTCPKCSTLLMRSPVLASSLSYIVLYKNES